MASQLEVLQESVKQVLQKDYEGISYISKGASGTVWKVLKDGKEIAVKVIASKNDMELERLAFEIKILRALQDNCGQFLCIYGVLEVGGLTIIEMEYLSGMIPLDEFIKKHIVKDPDGKLNYVMGESFKQAIIKNLIKIVRALHEFGIVHFDIKPANIMIADDLRLKLIDFGMGCMNGDSKKDKKCFGELKGTPNYIAPEVMVHQNVRTFQEAVKADYWSLGVVIYVINTGHVPFYHAKSVPDIKTELLTYCNQFAAMSSGLMMRVPNHRNLPLGVIDEEKEAV